MVQNRRKSRALIRAGAHFSPLGVRVKALTNKAAHYGSNLVRTAVCAIRVLTSISRTVRVEICRPRRGRLVAVACGVRIGTANAHFARISIGRTAHKNVDTAHQNECRMRESRIRHAFAAACVAVWIAVASTQVTIAAELPPSHTANVQFTPLEDQANVPEMFRLEAHSFPFVQTFIADASRTTDVSEVTFPSPLETEHACNNTVHCEYFRPHGPGRRPAVVVLHILGGDFPLARLFSRYLAASGTPALFLKMPYYGPRRPTDVRKRMIDVDPRDSVVGMRQAVLDIRRAGAWLASREEVDPEQIGIFGISLGGITAALAAEQEPRFRNVCLMLAGGDLGRVSWESSEVRQAREHWLAKGGTKEEFFTVLQPIDPATYAERLRSRRLFMINASQDEVIPPACTTSLWEKAGKPPIVWLDAGHYSAALYMFHGLAEVTRFFRREPML